MRVLGGAAGLGVIIGCKQALQFLIFRSPLFIALVKGLRQTAPAHITHQNLFCLRADAIFGHIHLAFLQILEQADGGDVVGKLGLCAAVAKPVVRAYSVTFRLVSTPAFCKISQSLIPWRLASHAESEFSTFASLVHC